MIHDFRRDWQSWTLAERLLAAIIVSACLLSIPTTILMAV